MIKKILCSMILISCLQIIASEQYPRVLVHNAGIDTGAMTINDKPFNGSKILNQRLQKIRPGDYVMINVQDGATSTSKNVVVAQKASQLLSTGVLDSSDYDVILYEQNIEGLGQGPYTMKSGALIGITKGDFASNAFTKSLDFAVPSGQAPLVYVLPSDSSAQSSFKIEFIGSAGQPTEWKGSDAFGKAVKALTQDEHLELTCMQGTQGGVNGLTVKLMKNNQEIADSAQFLPIGTGIHFMRYIPAGSTDQAEYAYTYIPIQDTVYFALYPNTVDNATGLYPRPVAFKNAVTSALTAMSSSSGQTGVQQAATAIEKALWALNDSYGPDSWSLHGSEVTTALATANSELTPTGTHASVYKQIQQDLTLDATKVTAFKKAVTAVLNDKDTQNEQAAGVVSALSDLHRQYIPGNWSQYTNEIASTLAAAGLQPSGSNQALYGVVENLLNSTQLNTLNTSLITELKKLNNTNVKQVADAVQAALTTYDASYSTGSWQTHESSINNLLSSIGLDTEMTQPTGKYYQVYTALQANWSSAETSKAQALQQEVTKAMNDDSKPANEKAADIITALKNFDSKYIPGTWNKHKTNITSALSAAGLKSSSKLFTYIKNILKAPDNKSLSTLNTSLIAAIKNITSSSDVSDLSTAAKNIASSSDASALSTAAKSIKAALVAYDPSYGSGSWSSHQKTITSLLSSIGADVSMTGAKGKYAGVYAALKTEFTTT